MWYNVDIRLVVSLTTVLARSNRTEEANMTRNLSLVAVLVVLVFVGACGKAPTDPGGGGGNNQLPVTTIPPGTEVYTPVAENGNRLYVSTISGKVYFPDGCVKAEPQRINPARGSRIPMDYEVAINLAVSLCAEAPLSALGDGAAITPMYDMVNQVDGAWQHATDWLSGGAGPVPAGQSRDVLWSSRVYGSIPPSIKGLRVRWRWGRNGDSSGYLRVDGDGSEAFVVIPLDWQIGG